MGNHPLLWPNYSGESVNEFLCISTIYPDVYDDILVGALEHRIMFPASGKNNPS